MKRLLPWLLAAAMLSGCASSAPREDRTPAAVQAVGEWTGDPLVSTRFGDVQGYADRELTWVWPAIPYAAPPVGDLRWRAPRDPEPWTGIRERHEFNGGCTQFVPRGRAIQGSEDCLYLNVWRSQGAEAKLPVYVWIHGGGNSSGSSTEVPFYYGIAVASRSRVVFVSINYRLGPFGWFTSPAFRDAAPPDEASGNYGTLDIVKALRWIQENIAAFGGDPSRVTVAGQSAGASNILSLLLSPDAAGLFHGAIYESGLPICATLSRADARSFQTLRTLLLRDHRAADDQDARRVADQMSPGSVREYLCSKSDREILECYAVSTLGILDNPAPLLDGHVLPLEGYALLDTGNYPNKVPLIMGSNKEEAKLFLMLAAIPWQSELYSAVAQWGSDMWKAVGVDEPARKLTASPGQPPVYVYRFDWGAPDAEGRSVEPGDWGRRLGASHDLEIPFFLGLVSFGDILDPLLALSESTPGRLSLSAAMMSYAARFAWTGNPNAPASALPEWRPWSNDDGGPKCIIFDAGRDSASLMMSDVELSASGVMDSMESGLSEPLLGQVKEIITTTRFN